MSDLISRQAAIDALRDARHRFTVADEAGGFGTVKWSEDVIYFAAAERVLSDLPSAEPKPKTGKWIRHDEVRNVYGGTCVECSECGEKYVVRHIEDEKYCRNCGADMRGNKE